MGYASPGATIVIEKDQLFFWLAIGHLNPGAIRYDGILWNHDYSVAHVKVFRVQVGSFAVRGYDHPLADPGVFVDDRSIDHRISPNTQRR
jgi:hypothetical protein